MCICLIFLVQQEYGDEWWCLKYLFLVMFELVKPVCENVHDWQIDWFFGLGIYSGIWHLYSGYLVPHILRPVCCLETAGTKHPVM